MSTQHGDELLPYVYEPLVPGQIKLMMTTDDKDRLSWLTQVVNLDDEIAFDTLLHSAHTESVLYHTLQ